VRLLYDKNHAGVFLEQTRYTLMEMKEFKLGKENFLYLICIILIYLINLKFYFIYQ